MNDTQRPIVKEFQERKAREKEKQMSDVGKYSKCKCGLLLGHNGDCMTDVAKNTVLKSRDKTLITEDGKPLTASDLQETLDVEELPKPDVPWDEMKMPPLGPVPLWILAEKYEQALRDVDEYTILICAHLDRHKDIQAAINHVGADKPC